MDKGKKEEAMDPIVMEEYQRKKIMTTTGKMRSGVTYQYKMNNKKRVIENIEVLESDEEEVEYLRAMDKIEEILRATYERKKYGPREGIEGITPIHVSVSVEPISPCETNTPEITPRKPNFSGRKKTRSTSKQGATIGGDNSRSSSQISTPCRGSSSTQLEMAGHDPTIRLP
jgi:hypothetical protein